LYSQSAISQETMPDQLIFHPWQKHHRSIYRKFWRILSQKLINFWKVF